MPEATGVIPEIQQDADLVVSEIDEQIKNNFLPDKIIADIDKVLKPPMLPRLTRKRVTAIREAVAHDGIALGLGIGGAVVAGALALGVPVTMVIIGTGVAAGTDLAANFFVPRLKEQLTTEETKVLEKHSGPPKLIALLHTFTAVKITTTTK